MVGGKFLRKPKPRARAHRCWACRAPGGVCRSAWLRNIGREKAFLPRSRGSSQERTVKPSGRTDEIVDCSRMSDAGEVYVTQTFRSGRLPIVRALLYLYALPMIGRSCSHCPAGHLHSGLESDLHLHAGAKPGLFLHTESYTQGLIQIYSYTLQKTCENLGAT